MNWTNYKLYDDIELRILLYPHVGFMDDDIELMSALHGEEDELVLYISLLGGYYFLQGQHTSYHNGKYGFSDQVYNPNKFKVEAAVRTYLKQLGLQEIGEKEALQLVPDISTELKELGEVCVFDCLFNDLFGPV